MKNVTVTQVPMKCFRVETDGTYFDIFIPDTTDLSSIVNITDEEGNQVPFDQWEKFTQILNEYLH
jgi:hypothetical protein